MYGRTATDAAASSPRVLPCDQAQSLHMATLYGAQSGHMSHRPAVVAIVAEAYCRFYEVTVFFFYLKGQRFNTS